MIQKLEKGKKYWLILPASAEYNLQEQQDALKVHGIDIVLATGNSWVKEFQIFEIE